LKLTRELKELIIKWKKILKLEDWDFDIQLECPKKYREIEEAVGFEPGLTRGMNTSTEERQHSLIILNAEAGDTLEDYLVHELNHSMLNEMAEFASCLIEMVENEEVKSVLKVRRDEILEKLVWKITRITLELDRGVI
jgi:hypothetical protein